MPFAAAALMLGCVVSIGAEPPRLSRTGAQPVVAAEAPINYILRVDWKSKKGETNSRQLLTTGGTFKVNTSQPDAAFDGWHSPHRDAALISVGLRATIDLHLIDLLPGR